MCVLLISSILISVISPSWHGPVIIQHLDVPTVPSERGPRYLEIFWHVGETWAEMKFPFGQTPSNYHILDKKVPMATQKCQCGKLYAQNWCWMPFTEYPPSACGWLQYPLFPHPLFETSDIKLLGTYLWLEVGSRCLFYPFSIYLLNVANGTVRAAIITLACTQIGVFSELHTGFPFHSFHATQENQWTRLEPRNPSKHHDDGVKKGPQVLRSPSTTTHQHPPRSYSNVPIDRYQSCM